MNNLKVFVLKVFIGELLLIRKLIN